MRNDAEVESRARSDRVAVLKRVADPVTFARTFLRSDLWRTQEKILRAIATNPRVAAKSCHASGKTFVGRSRRALVVDQIHRRHRHHDRAVLDAGRASPLGRDSSSRRAEPYRVPATEPDLVEARAAELRHRSQHRTRRSVSGLSRPRADRPRRGSRAPARHLRGHRRIRAAGEVRVLALGNPTIASGPFYDAFAANRETWKTFTISAFDTPNLAGALARPASLALRRGAGPADRLT